ncbi:MAG: FecR family protein [bacterium]|nr:FecR family protein [bacterium]
MKISSLLWICLLLCWPLSASALNPVATLYLLDKSVTLDRAGKLTDLRQIETPLTNGDRIETGPSGRAKLTFENGDVTFLGPNSQLTVSAEPEGQNWKIELNLVGKLRALVNKRQDKNFRVRTVSAVIGVKGTDFVADAPGAETRVATFKGLVFLRSLKTQQDIDVPAGKEGAIGPAGEIMPLRDIAGDILEGVEIAGKQLSTEEAAGSKIGCTNC